MIGKRASLILLGGVVFPLILLLLLELCLRYLYPQGLSPLVGHPTLNHTWRPNSSWTHTEFESRGIPPYTHQYNDQAWLEKYDVTPTKPSGVYRIFFVGDSFTEGTVPMEKSLPSLFESAINNDCCTHPGGILPDGYQFEVINTGTSSYSPSLYYLLIKEKIINYEPDLVVINVDMTDIFDDFLYHKAAIFDSSGDLIAVPSDTSAAMQFERTKAGIKERNISSQFRKWVVDRSFLATIIYLELDRLKTKDIQPVKPDETELFAWCSSSWTEATRQKVEYSLDMLDRSVRLLRAHDVKVVLSAVPHLQHFNGRFSLLPFDTLKNFASKKGILYVDGYSYLKESLLMRSASELYIPGDMHFNPEGYKAWSIAFVEAFKTRTQ